MRYLAQVMAHIQMSKIQALPVSSFSRSIKSPRPSRASIGRTAWKPPAPLWPFPIGG
jgi:hypothetical protein